MSTCAGYHAVQHQRESNGVDGRQDQRLQHVQPDPPPDQVHLKAHHLQECQEGHRLEVRGKNISCPRLICKTDFRLVVMSLRAQSLLNLRLYKMKRHELKDYQRTIQDVLAKSGEEEVCEEIEYWDILWNCMTGTLHLNWKPTFRY